MSRKTTPPDSDAHAEGTPLLSGGHREGCAYHSAARAGGGEASGAVAEATATALVTVRLTAAGDIAGEVANAEVREEDGYRDLVCPSCGAPLPDLRPPAEAPGAPPGEHAAAKAQNPESAQDRERARFKRWVRDVALDLLGSGEISYPEALEDLTSEDGLAPDPTTGRPAFYEGADDRAGATEDLMYLLYRHAFAPLVEGTEAGASRTGAFLNVVVNADPSEDEADVAGVLMPAGRSGEGPPSLVFHAFRAWLKNYTATSEEDLFALYRLVLSSAVAPYDEPPDGGSGGAVARGAPERGAGEAA